MLGRQSSKLENYTTFLYTCINSIKDNFPFLWKAIPDSCKIYRITIAGFYLQVFALQEFCQATKDYCPTVTGTGIQGPPGNHYTFPESGFIFADNIM